MSSLACHHDFLPLSSELKIMNTTEHQSLPTPQNIADSDDAKMLEYVLDDFLELRASLNASQAKRLKEFLLPQRLAGMSLSTIAGFILANHLVILNSTDWQTIERLVWVEPGAGRIRVKNL